MLSLFPVQVPFWRYRWRGRCASRATFFSPLSTAPVSYALNFLKSSTLFVLTRKRGKRGCIEHRVVNNNFRNALTLHYNFGGYFTSSINLFYERWIYCFATYSHRGFKPAQFECVLRAMQCILAHLQSKWSIFYEPTLCYNSNTITRVSWGLAVELELKFTAKFHFCEIILGNPNKYPNGMT